MYSCSCCYTYTTGVKTKDKSSTTLLIGLFNQSCCFEEVHLKVIDHSTGAQIVVQNENVPVEGSRDQLIEIPLSDVYYGNAMNITFYEVQLCLPHSNCIMINIYELNDNKQIIPSQTITSDQLKLLGCYC